MKVIQGEKLIQTLIFPKPATAYDILIRRNIMQYIYLFTPKEAEIGGSLNRLVEGSTTWIVFMAHLLSGFSPSLHIVTLNLSPLCSSKSHKYNNYDKATHKVSLFLVYSLALRPQALHEISTPEAYQKGCFSNSAPCFWCQFCKQNINIPGQS